MSRCLAFTAQGRRCKNRCKRGSASSVCHAHAAKVAPAPTQQCPICFDVINKEDMDGTQVLPCSHAFCPPCINAWFCTGRPTCPLCRADVPSARAIGVVSAFSDDDDEDDFSNDDATDDEFNGGDVTSAPLEASSRARRRRSADRALLVLHSLRHLLF